MNDEKLIECVRKYNFLYDLTHPKYMDAKYKAKTWREIGEELQQPDTVCKTRWQNIRDQFRKYRAKNITKSGQAAQKQRKHKYEDILSFLLPCFAERDTISNIQSLSGCSEQSVDDSQQNLEVENEQLQFITNELSQPIQSTESTQTIQPSESHETTHSTTSKTSIHGNRKRNYSGTSSTITPKETPSSKLMEYILDREKADAEKLSNPHPIDAFLNGIGVVLKQFSPYYQHIARGKIFNIVHELESQQIHQEHLPRCFTPIMSWSTHTTVSGPIDNDCSIQNNETVASSATPNSQFLPSTSFHQ